MARELHYIRKARFYNFFLVKENRNLLPDYDYWTAILHGILSQLRSLNREELGIVGELPAPEIPGLIKRVK